MANQKTWTLMFYFASDNSLSSSMLSQVKAIKDAGHHPNANVLVFFDPTEIGVPTRIFEVNRERKLHTTRPVVGDGEDSFVRSMIEDEVVVGAIAHPKPATKELARKLKKEQETKVDVITARDALRLFLGFSRENYNADHYMLFLMGHGMIVASEGFLTDEDPEAAITLREFGEILRAFSLAIRRKKGTLELIGMPSCSMSAVEVIYQLKGTANYMLASQGLSFVGSWPYRQLLKQTFKELRDDGNRVNIPEMIWKFARKCFHNSTDFDYMGHNADVCLCRLTGRDVRLLDNPIRNLVVALRSGLNDHRTKNLIILAHWESQSYWQEHYTDLFDFCLCLGRSCDPNHPIQSRIKTACDNIMKRLSSPFVYSYVLGKTNQYSHGLSVYFPWSKPKENSKGRILKDYKKYLFTSELRPNSWLSFLNSYWSLTERAPRLREEPGVYLDKFDIRLMEAFQDVLEPGKPDPTVGKDDCTCPSVKNYPNELYLSKGVLRDFLKD